jgi:hypothetical protein
MVPILPEDHWAWRNPRPIPFIGITSWRSRASIEKKPGNEESVSASPGVFFPGLIFHGLECAGVPGAGHFSSQSEPGRYRGFEVSACRGSLPQREKKGQFAPLFVHFCANFKSQKVNGLSAKASKT